MTPDDLNSPDDVELRLRLSRLPRHNAPSRLMTKLRHEFVSPPWWQSWRTAFSWKPAGAFAAAVLVAALWLTYQKREKPKTIDFAPLLAAHMRTQSQTLVPDSDMTAADFSYQLASYEN